MKTNDDPVSIITRKLDLLQERLGTYDRLQRRGATIDQKIIGGMEDLYAHNLQLLRDFKAYDDFRAYTTWWKRYWNNGDPL